ncbi:Retrovirus-related Pol polyprotein from type-2 retrotransposable element R2DM [Araneus ventricosus]|uniref:Retrovirus-related Pol polyprotein from type-2 retrotransposable element R2DM n=1 Tax=Araneus ventricosus TaxID=182803 RepID=A0A4Y2T5K6_ARAVE|nr:Retrovirus-related Pol polyprotein from type-2 retrotransposable element R2DM [Araneus ventricosus]
MVIDQLIKKLKGRIGLEIDGSTMSISAYADDILLFASSSAGLQHLLNETSDFLEMCNLTINCTKSFTISILVDAKNKKTKYLGLNFSAKGLLVANCDSTLNDYLSKLKSAPLKSQQRLWILRNTLLPKLFHLLVLSSVPAGKLAKLDSITRAFVRGALYLPGDCPNSFIHASVADGGPSLRVSVPLWRRSRLGSLGGSAGEYLQRLIERVKNIQLTENSRTYFAQKLYQTVDGGALSNSAKVKNQNLWIQSKNKFLSGRDYVNLIKTKILCLPIAYRCARGRPAKDKFCRAGCPHKETLNHVSQACPRTHGKRIQRHDAVVNYIRRALENRRHEVISVPLYKTSMGNRKPNLLAKKDGKKLIIDAQIDGEAVDLERANNRKISFYRNNVELDQAIQVQHGSPNINYLSATLNLRGVWSSKSAFDLIEKFKVLNRSYVPVVSSRVLLGTFAGFSMFSRPTVRATRN